MLVMPASCSVTAAVSMMQKATPFEKDHADPGVELDAAQVLARTGVRREDWRSGCDPRCIRISSTSCEACQKKR